MDKLKMLLKILELDDLAVAALEILDTIAFNTWIYLAWQADHKRTIEAFGEIKHILDETHNRLNKNWTASEMYEVHRALTKVIHEANEALNLSPFLEIEVTNSFADTILRSRTCCISKAN